MQKGLDFSVKIQMFEEAYIPSLYVKFIPMSTIKARAEKIGFLYIILSNLSFYHLSLGRVTSLHYQYVIIKDKIPFPIPWKVSDAVIGRGGQAFLETDYAWELFGVPDERLRKIDGIGLRRVQQFVKNILLLQSKLTYSLLTIYGTNFRSSRNDRTPY